jgi:hypothetical protein
VETFFTDKPLQDIVRHSVRKLESLNLQNTSTLTVLSLRAYLGIMYFRGCNDDNNIPVNDLWSEDYSSFYRTAMSRNTFKLWTRVMRFDDPSERLAKYSTDTFAAIRDFWMEWNETLSKYFRPTECVTVDEQLPSKNCIRAPMRASTLGSMHVVVALLPKYSPPYLVAREYNHLYF